jgi:hypothetical protein
MYFLREWFATVKTEKTSEWAATCIRFSRTYARQMVSDDEAATGMAYLEGTQSLSWLEEQFLNPGKINLTNENIRRINPATGTPIQPHTNHKEFLNDHMRNANFVPLKILEKFLQINIAEMQKVGMPLDVRAIDPTSSEQRKQDANLLKNKPQIEKDLSEIHNKIGEPPVKLDHYKARFGEDPANGNIDAFKSMGLTDGDAADVNQFINYFYKLKQEISAQDIIEYIATVNDDSRKVQKWVRDMWSKKAIAGYCHVSDVTGQIVHDYLAPETVWIYGTGRREDFDDANAKFVQYRVSIREMLDLFGNSFDFETQFSHLLMAITFAGQALEWTGIRSSNQTIGWGDVRSGKQTFRMDGRESNYDDFMSLKVVVGYIEWDTQNQNAFGEVDKSKGSSVAEDNQPTNEERYQTKARFETPMYKSFYLATSLIDQVLFNFGEMTYQQIEGYNDINSKYSIITWKEPGTPLAITAIPFLDLAHEVWFKMLYEYRRAKPSGMMYNYSSIISMMENLYTDQQISREAKLQKFISFLDSSANQFYDYPIGPDGKAIINNAGQVHIPLENGPSQTVKIYWEQFIATLDELQEICTGRSPLRAGDPGNSRDSMNNQFKALEYSQNSTAYIPEMLTFMYQQYAQKTMLYVQDIIQFKDYNTLAYKYLEDGVGKEALETIKGLGKKAMHKYGIFIESIDQTAQRAKLSQRIDFALQTSKITNAQALLVEDIKSPKKAFLWLAYFEEKTQKQVQQNAMQLQMQKTQGDQQTEQMKMQGIKLKGDYDVQVATIQASADKQGKIINQQGGLAKKAMEHTSDMLQIEAEADADLKRQSQNIDNTGKQNPPAPQPVAIPSGGPAPAPNVPQSAIQQNIASSQPVAPSEARQ